MTVGHCSVDWEIALVLASGKMGIAEPTADRMNFRDTERGRMLETLKYLLKKARSEAGKKENSPELRLKWVNTMCYITQTCNSVLKDADYDELRQQLEYMQEEVIKIREEKLRKPQTVIGKDRVEPERAQPTA